MLVHGAGFRDDTGIFNYWGRIPKKLTDKGALVLYSAHDAWGSIEKCAEQINNSINEYREEYHFEKINIIAHSKGGLDSRYLISTLNKGHIIASLTTISTPHHGSKTLDIVYKLPPKLFGIISPIVSKYFTLLGDKNADFGNALRSFSTESAKKFNKENIDDPNVKYQSYAGKMKTPLSDILFFWQNILIKIIEGDNDGLVSVESAKYGQFNGIIKSKNMWGISHSDEVDLWRRKRGKYDICDLYESIVIDLKSMGF